MKLFVIFFILVSASLQLHADFKMPRGAFTWSELNEAKVQAAEDGKPIAVLYSDSETSCPKCVATTDLIFQKTRFKYTLVVCDKSKGEQVTGNLMKHEMRNRNKNGNTYPFLTVTDSSTKHYLGGITYSNLSGDGQRAMRNLRKEVEKNLEEVSGNSSPTKTEKEITSVTAQSACEVGGLETWTATNGRTIRAELVSSTPSKVILRMENGKEHTLPMSRLDEESQKRAKSACAIPIAD